MSSILKQAHARPVCIYRLRRQPAADDELSQGETMASKHLLGVSATAVADSKRRERYKQQKQIQACPCKHAGTCMIKQQIARSARTGTQEKTLRLREFHSHVVHVAAEGLQITLCSRSCYESVGGGLIRRPACGHNVTRRGAGGGGTLMFACWLRAPASKHPLVKILVFEKRSFVLWRFFTALIRPPFLAGESPRPSNGL